MFSTSCGNLKWMDGWDGWMEWNGWNGWVDGKGGMPLVDCLHSVENQTSVCRKSDFGLSKIRLRSVENQTPSISFDRGRPKHCRKSDYGLSKIRLRRVENQTSCVENQTSGTNHMRMVHESLIQSLSRAPKPTSKSLPRRRAQLFQRFTPPSFARSHFSQKKIQRLQRKIRSCWQRWGATLHMQWGFQLILSRILQPRLGNLFFSRNTRKSAARPTSRKLGLEEKHLNFLSKCLPVSFGFSGLRTFFAVPKTAPQKNA